MPRTLIVPGVSVEARFDVPPPLPARSGILGAVGVVDQIPESGVAGVTTSQELFELFGPATRLSFPEALSALINGVSEVIVSPVAPETGQAASVTLNDDEGDQVALLRARAVGPWGNDLSVRVIRSLAADRRTVRRMTLEVLYKDRPIERHDNMILRPGDDNDLFTVINRDSGVLVAVDPVFQEDLPHLDSALEALTSVSEAAASGTLTAAAASLIDLSALRPGSGGNRISLEVSQGRAVLVLSDTNGDPSVRIRAAETGAQGTSIRITITDDGSGGVNVIVEAPGAAARTYENLTSIAGLVQTVNEDPAILVERLGNLTPAPSAAANLAQAVTVTVQEEGVRTHDYEDLSTATAIAEALNGDPSLTASLVGDAATLPDVGDANTFYLAGGQDAGSVRRYVGQNNPSNPILELRATEGSDADRIRLHVEDGAEPNTVRLTIGLQLDTGFEEQEVFDNLSMDPDHPNYLPTVLEEGSGLLRALDLYTRALATHWPVATMTPRPLREGAAPAMSAWQAAIDALAQEDDVDMVLVGLQEWKDTNLNGIQVQQSLLGHARGQADGAKPRIVLGSVPPEANDDPSAIIDHVGQVADRRFVLVAPSGAEGAMAGLLGHLEYFQSPTFKTIAQPGVPLTVYSESDLNKLIGPEGNICVIAQKRGRGTICLKGIATDGFQISVVRVADRAIREVKKISDRFIGELNNAESRNALKQMIVATFTQMERDGALVPSVDGSSPAFEVDVYASQNDVAAGNARIDIAVRPVRAIDYIYATIRVRN
ncbi:hypothetical protein KFU94_44630 [Chloroflexi bacterium TSY]|nr:hypothetical protein [Chloroflexi bacterium TSY]